MSCATKSGAKCIFNESKCFLNENKGAIIFVGGVAAAAAIGYGVYWYFYNDGNGNSSHTSPSTPPPPSAGLDGRRPRRRSRSRTRSDASKKRSPSLKPSTPDVLTARPVCTPVPPATSAAATGAVPTTATSVAEISTSGGPPSYAKVAAKDLNDQKTQEDSHDK